MKGEGGYLKPSSPLAPSCLTPSAARETLLVPLERDSAAGTWERRAALQAMPASAVQTPASLHHLKKNCKIEYVRFPLLLLSLSYSPYSRINPGDGTGESDDNGPALIAAAAAPAAAPIAP